MFSSKIFMKVYHYVPAKVWEWVIHFCDLTVRQGTQDLLLLDLSSTAVSQASLGNRECVHWVKHTRIHTAGRTRRISVCFREASLRNRDCQLGEAHESTHYIQLAGQEGCQS